MIELMPLQPHPKSFNEVFTENTEDSKHFQKYIHYYNNTFIFALCNVRKDNFNGGVSAVRAVSDVSVRATSSILSAWTTDKPQYGQLCIYDSGFHCIFIHQRTNCMPSVLT
jgi:hypothetical protein